MRHWLLALSLGLLFSSSANAQSGGYPDFSDLDVYQLLLDHPQLIRVCDGMPNSKVRDSMCHSIEQHLNLVSRGVQP